MKPYNSYSEYLKKQFGSRVQKLSVHLGLSCPNRDGTKGTSGCIYCLNEAFTPSYCHPSKSISQQIQDGISFHQNRYRRAKAYLAYFQAFSNTYISPAQMEHIIQTTIEIPGIIGLIFSTRPDTIDETTCKLFRKYSYKTFIKVELGIESIYDQTLTLINRHHSFSHVLNALSLLHAYQIPVCGHFIFGLPGETTEMMIASAEIISKLPLQSVKFHQLQIYTQTPLAQLVRDGKLHPHLFELHEYIDFIIDFCERLNPNICIERFAGEAPPRYVVAPQWGLIRYDQILQKIEQQFIQRNTYQGRLYKT